MKKTGLILFYMFAVLVLQAQELKSPNGALL